MSAATDVRTQLMVNLKELHLPTFRDCFEEVAQQDSFGYERYLLELAERECADRRHRRIERLLRESRLPLEKDLESLDLKRLPNKVVNQVKTLLEGFFLDRKENVLAFGVPCSFSLRILGMVTSRFGLMVTIYRSIATPVFFL